MKVVKNKVYCRIKRVSGCQNRRTKYNFDRDFDRDCGPRDTPWCMKYNIRCFRSEEEEMNYVWNCTSR